MSPPSPIAPRPSPLLPLAQAALGIAVLVAATLCPRAGQAALYLPLAGRAALDPGGAAVLGPGRLRGSLLIRVPDARFAWSALARPALVIAVPAGWCGSPDQSTPYPNRNPFRA